jgi:predicted phosphodiesterase
MTKLAVLSDIHGNSIALRAVLNDLARQGGVDHLILLGDLVVFGPDPWGVLALLQEYRPIFHIRGNTDRYLVEGKYPGCLNGQDWRSQVLASFPWTAEVLGKTGLQFLAQLSSQQLLRFSQQHVILAVHGSPRNDEENIRPNTSDTELAAMLNIPLVPSLKEADGQYNLLLCAHTHVLIDRIVSKWPIINTGSVGLPFDGNPPACYVLINLQPEDAYQIEFRRVAYDLEIVIDQLKATNHPTADSSATQSGTHLYRLDAWMFKAPLQRFVKAYQT